MVWIVRRTDYEDERDEDGSQSIVGSYTTLQQANDVAEQEAEENEPCNDFEEERRGGNGTELEITFRGTFYGFPLFQVCVEEVKRQGPQADSDDEPQFTHATINSKFGSMVAIPGGKVGGLAGTRFCLSGKWEVLTDTTARLAVHAYGGVVVEDVAQAHYFVAGKGMSAKQQKEAIMFGDRKLDEKSFFELIKEGVPKDVPGKLDDKSERAQDGMPPTKRARC